MTQPNTQDWEDIIPRGTDTKKVTEKTGPFAAVRPVDGYAFTLDPESPELRYQREPQAEVPAIPRREPPQRLRDQVRATGVWQPGGPARTEQPQLRTSRPSVVKALLSALIPLALLVGGVYLVMRLYQ
jgi:hypothetical protein